jgi:hypothetical protein
MLIESLLKIPFSVIGRCSSMPTSPWLWGKCGRINLSLAAFGIILQNHRRLPVSISVSKSPHGLLEGFSKLMSNFNGETKTLLIFSIK